MIDLAKHGIYYSTVDKMDGGCEDKLHKSSNVPFSPLSREKSEIDTRQFVRQIKTYGKENLRKKLAMGYKTAKTECKNRMQKQGVTSTDTLQASLLTVTVNRYVMCFGVWH